MAKDKTYNYAPSAKEREIIKRVEAMFGVADKARTPLRKLWRECEALYMDGHWSLEGMPKNLNQIQVNLIAAAIDTMIPILSARPPRVDVMPASTDASDLQVSRVMQAQLDDLWELRDMQNTIAAFLMDFLVYGTGVLKFGFGHDDLPDCDVVDPFAFYVNPMATKMEDAEWVIYAAPVLVSEIKEKYDKGKFVEPQSNLGQYEAMKMYQDFTGSTVVPTPDGENMRYESPSKAAESLEERTLLIECWYRDGEKDYTEDGEGIPKYPGTRLTTVANGVLLYDGPSPYPFLTRENNIVHPYPFVVAKNGGVAHSFYGRPEPKRLKTINLSMDMVASQIMDNISLMANPMWVVDETAGVTEQITNRPGGIVRKSGPGQVTMQQPASVPPYVMNYFQLMESMFEVVSGVTRSTQGREAPNVTSGVQAEVYRRASTSKIDFKARMIDAAIQQLGAIWLSMIQNLSVDEHRVTITEDLGDVEYGFTGIELRDKKMRVRAKAGSMMPDNRTYIEEKVLALAQMGIIQDPEFILENVELPNKQRLLDKMREQRAIQETAEQEVDAAQVADDEVLKNSVDEDEIMSVLERRPELMTDYQ